MKKSKKILKKFGDILTLRLSKKAGVTQEILEWINNNDGKDIIEAIKLKMKIDEKKNYIEIAEIAEIEASVSREEVENKDNNKDKEIVINYYEENNESELYVSKEKTICNDEELETHIITKNDKKITNLGLQAVQMLRKMK